MRFGTNKEKNTKLGEVRGGFEMTGKGESWHTKEEEEEDMDELGIMRNTWVFQV